jgi:hypothetical protein
MEILPARIQPLTRRIARKHRPRQTSSNKGYQRYRECLRWEFGFICSLCMAQEVDLVASGVKGTGITTIEHIQRQETHPELANTYENCLYVCRSCNRARGIRPWKNERGDHLLDPTSATWSDHFISDGDRLKPRPGDGHATYTHKAYDLDNPAKRELRASRRKHIEYLLRIIRRGPMQLRKLEQRIARSREAHDAAELRDLAKSLRMAIDRAWGELKRYSAIPADRSICRCEAPPTLELPQALAEQVIVITSRVRMPILSSRRDGRPPRVTLNR